MTREEREDALKFFEDMAALVGDNNAKYSKLAIEALEQEPKTGHWIAYEVRLPDRTILNYRCSVCGRKLIGYNTETLSEAPYCHCGAKMIEPQESEG
jgi:DNA-directed RNA polymerase subunit RPC12/RpoP